MSNDNKNAVKSSLLVGGAFAAFWGVLAWLLDANGVWSVMWQMFLLGLAVGLVTTVYPEE